MGKSSMFKSYIGDKDIAGRTGDTFTMESGDTIQIVGYTNAGKDFLVKRVGSEANFYLYVYREK